MTDVVAALIWDDNRFLACQRPAHKARALLWEFVGGKVEPGECWEDALIRECREELGVTIKPMDIFMEVTHSYPDITVHLILYNAVITEGEITLYEHNDACWMAPADIPQYAFCPADKEILQAIMERYC